MSSPWKIEGQIARLRIGPLAAQLNLRFPQQGLHEVLLNDARATDAPAAFLAAITQAREIPEVLQDCYVRGSDLVVTYAETSQRNIRPQMYWRAFTFPDDDAQSCGVDLILSTQTSQLYSDPTLWVESHVRAFGGQFPIATTDLAGPILVRLDQRAWSFSQAVHPSDFQSLHMALDGEGRIAIGHRLFIAGLEKGVIRRARIRGLFAPREPDATLTAASFAQFVKQDLPLTT